MKGCGIFERTSFNSAATKCSHLLESGFRWWTLVATMSSTLPTVVSKCSFKHKTHWVVGLILPHFARILIMVAQGLRLMGLHCIVGSIRRSITAERCKVLWPLSPEASWLCLLVLFVRCWLRRRRERGVNEDGESIKLWDMSDVTFSNPLLGCRAFTLISRDTTIDPSSMCVPL